MAFQKTYFINQNFKKKYFISFNAYYYQFCFDFPGSITNIDDDAVKCTDGTSPEIRNKVISGVVGAASSVTSIQVANLLRLFKIPQVCAEKKIIKKLLF